MSGAHRQRELIAGFTVGAIAISLLVRFGVKPAVDVGGLPLHELPLIAAVVLGGLPLVVELLIKLIRREFGSDLLAGISIVTSIILGEHLAGALVVLMLSGGEALEAYAVRSASSVLQALAKRMPSVAHRRRGGDLADLPLDEVTIGDTLVVFPHEICPVDGTVVEGHGVMDESYLTGEPYLMSKAPGSTVLSGAIPRERRPGRRQGSRLAAPGGDGIQRAPRTAATVGIAFGQNSDITAEAAGAVILESSLGKADELLHVGRRLRSIALQSAVGGMALSALGMLLAAVGYLPPVAGAIAQEVIDVVAVLNALRVAMAPRKLTDYAAPAPSVEQSTPASVTSAPLAH